MLPVIFFPKYMDCYPFKNSLIPAPRATEGSHKPVRLPLTCPRRGRPDFITSYPTPHPHGNGSFFSCILYLDPLKKVYPGALSPDRASRATEGSHKPLRSPLTCPRRRRPHCMRLVAAGSECERLFYESFAGAR